MKTNVPEIRFKGFSDEWHEKYLDEQVDFYSGLTYSPSDVIITNGAFVLRSSNVKNNEIIRADDVYVKYEAVNCDNVKKGDVIVVVRNGSRSLIGKHAQIKEFMRNTVIGAFMTGIRSKQPDFINALLDTNQFHKETEKNLGATINQITNGMFKKMLFLFPCIKEQSKIGTYFKNLDDLISLRQRKLDKLITVKKAMLENIFPREGADVPEIRFKGFEGTWERKTLGELMNVTSVKRIHQSDWTSHGIRFLRARDIVSKFKRENQTDLLYISEEKYKEYSILSGKVQKGDLLVTGVGTIGIPMLIKNDEPIYFKDGNIIWFKNNNAVEGHFLYYSFLNKRIQSFITESAGIGTVGTYTIESGKKTPILLPVKKEEQTQIGSYFNNFDNLISLEQKEIVKLKQFKSSCLEKMFV